MGGASKFEYSLSSSRLAKSMLADVDEVLLVSLAVHVVN